MAGIRAGPLKFEGSHGGTPPVSGVPQRDPSNLRGPEAGSQAELLNFEGSRRRTPQI